MMIQVPSSPNSVCDPLSCDSTNRQKLPTAHGNERCGRPVVAGEGHSAGEQQNERMDVGGGQVGGKLVWPTREELFREPPPPPECDICSLPMGSNSGKRSIEGSAAISLVSRYFVPCLASCDSIPRLTQCLPKSLAAESKSASGVTTRTRLCMGVDAVHTVANDIQMSKASREICVTASVISILMLYVNDDQGGLFV